MSPQLRVKSVSIEVTADKAGMVEYPIQHHPHSQAVGLLAESGKVLLTAQHRIDSAVIGCAIAVILCRLKNRTEIEGRHPQTAEIIQLFHYTPQVSAEKVPVADLSVLIGKVDQAVWTHRPPTIPAGSGIRVRRKRSGKI